MYALSSWLPKLMMAAGYSMDNSLMFMMVMNIGAVIGIVGGRSFSRSLPFETCADVLGHDGCCCNELDGLSI